MSNQPRATIPVVYVTEHWPNRSYPGAVIVKVVCPHCGKAHTHGGSSWATVEGHRVADCGNDNGYYVKIPASFQEAVA